MPDQFWSLTPREFHLKLEGYFRQQDREWLQVATLGCWVLSPWSKALLNPLKIIGREGRPFTVWPAHDPN